MALALAGDEALQELVNCNWREVRPEQRYRGLCLCVGESRGRQCDLIEIGAISGIKGIQMGSERSDTRDLLSSNFILTDC